MKFLFLNGFMLWPMLCIGMDRHPVDGNTLPLKRMRCCLTRAVATSFEFQKNKERDIRRTPLLEPSPAPDIPMEPFSLDAQEMVTQAPASPN